MASFIALERIRHRAALVGRVVDALSGQPMPQAEVRLAGGPPVWKERVAAMALVGGRALDATTADAEGFFKFIDLPAGAYQVTARVGGKRYAAATLPASVTVADATVLELPLAPTALTGVVRANTPAGPLAMARVRALGSGESTYTDANGAFTLSPLEPGTDRRFEVSAQRYVTAMHTVSLPAGQTTTAPSITLVQG